ncbi:MAG: cation:proton antiporter [Oscillospiraceae bacterium]|nr:cation:proton antiporter [Oscillospiraceae bacterium]
MLTSIALILLSGLFFSFIFTKMKLPGLLGMILVGIALGPHAMNLIDTSILNISADLRQIALVIILSRAGLSLNLTDLKKIGRPAVLMCFVPALVEMVGTIIFAPILLGITHLEAAIMGSVIAAVSPAVVVPRMIKLIDEGYGKDKSIPQLILAGASVDDVFVIVVFTVLTAFASTGEITGTSFLQIPLSIILGFLLGVIVGLCLVSFFRKVHIRDSVKVMIILSISFLLLELENRLEGIIPVSGLLAIMSMGITLNQKYDVLSKRISIKYNKLWLCAEVFLFVLVGIAVDIKYAFAAGAASAVVVMLALVFRMTGVFLSLVKTDLNKKERLFCMLSYTPKATVQAAIGTIPLAIGLDCGSIVLTVAVISILITAPFGAICIDKLYKSMLKK